MTNKEFEDFFKNLDPNDIPKIEDSTEDDTDISDFFEDKTSSSYKNDNKIKMNPEKDENSYVSGDAFAPPPPEKDDEDERTAVTKSTVSEQKIQKNKTVSKPVKTVKKSKVSNTKKRLMNWVLTIFWVAAVLAVSVFIASFALSSLNDLVGFKKESMEKEVTIPEGAGLNKIAEILKDEGIIDEPFAFEVYARIKKKKLAAGTYDLNSNLGYDQIFLAMKPKDTTLETVTITFFEGMTASEIAQKLEENGVCTVSDFMNEVDTAQFEYDFETMMGTDEYIYHKWEGYLFPDTYEFYLDMKPRSVILKFVDNFNNRITEAYYDRMKEMGMSLSETISLASVIQSEAASQEDMYKVSSVFHNRLSPSYWYHYLQSDVTYFYYQKEIEPYVSDDPELDEAYHTSYDTYFKEGVPVGPICNPGKDAIIAALYPDDTDYYYFVTDVNGTFYYSKTLEEHEINTAKADAVVKK